jgi:predicted enzyme related to lactoylglutathione lyase
MSASGNIVWHDLTIDNADECAEFYRKVLGWSSKEYDMGGYADHVMKSPDGSTVAGVCHAKGVNVGIPPQWLIYIQVDSVDEAICNCMAAGGSVIRETRTLDGQKFCVIQDPAGAVMGLIEPKAQD